MNYQIQSDILHERHCCMLGHRLSNMGSRQIRYEHAHSGTVDGVEPPGGHPHPPIPNSFFAAVIYLLLP